jgi:hypothetical protein
VTIAVACFVVLRTRQTGKAQLVVTFSHFENHNGLSCAVVRVANVGTKAAACYGYGWEAPFYYTVTASGTNWSWDYSPGFDSDKARPFKIPPGGYMAVRTGVPIPETWRIGIPYCDATIEERLPRRVWFLLRKFNPLKKAESVGWSQPLTRAAKPSNIVPFLPERTSEGETDINK